MGGYRTVGEHGPEPGIPPAGRGGVSAHGCPTSARRKAQPLAILFDNGHLNAANVEHLMRQWEARQAEQSHRVTVLGPGVEVSRTRYHVSEQDGVWGVTGTDFTTTDETLARAVAAEFERIEWRP